MDSARNERRRQVRGRNRDNRREAGGGGENGDVRSVYTIQGSSKEQMKGKTKVGKNNKGNNGAKDESDDELDKATRRPK